MTPFNIRLQRNNNLIPDAYKVRLDFSETQALCKFTQVINRAGDTETFVYQVLDIKTSFTPIGHTTFVELGNPVT